MKEKEVEIFYPESPAKWRKWLEKNHLTSQSVWLVGYNKKSGKKSITWAESVEVALCFGWIDSKKLSIPVSSTCNRGDFFLSGRRGRPVLVVG